MSYPRTDRERRIRQRAFDRAVRQIEAGDTLSQIHADPDVVVAAMEHVERNARNESAALTSEAYGRRRP